MIFKTWHTFGELDLWICCFVKYRARKEITHCLKWQMNGFVLLFIGPHLHTFFLFCLVVPGLALLTKWAFESLPSLAIRDTGGSLPNWWGEKKSHFPSQVFCFHWLVGWLVIVVQNKYGTEFGDFWGLPYRDSNSARHTVELSFSQHQAAGLFQCRSECLPSYLGLAPFYSFCLLISLHFTLWSN